MSFNAFLMVLIIYKGLLIQVFYNCTNSLGASCNSQPLRGQGKHYKETIVREGKATGVARITHVFFSRSMSGRAPPASFTFSLLLSKIHISNSSQKELQAEECNQIFKCDSPTGPL